MPYTDAKGRPEIVMHPDIKQSNAAWHAAADADADGLSPVVTEAPATGRAGRLTHLDRSGDVKKET